MRVTLMAAMSKIHLDFPMSSMHSYTHPMNALALAIPELIQHRISNDDIWVPRFNTGCRAPLVCNEFVGCFQGLFDVREVLNLQAVQVQACNPYDMIHGSKIKYNQYI